MIKYAKITKQQKGQIWALCGKDRAYQKQMVQTVTGSEQEANINLLSFEQANTLLVLLGAQSHGYINFAYYDYQNTQHKYILSLCYQLKWLTKKGTKDIPDLEKLGKFIAARTSAKKPLKAQTVTEVSETIISLEAVLTTR